MQQTLVEARGLTKSFKRPDGSEIKAVKGVDLAIHTGEIFSLLGPNGAGKTTTISMISGLLTPSAGDATIGGHSITKAPMAAKRLLGVVPQEIALYPMLSARQNLKFFGRMQGMRGGDLNRRVDEVLEFIDLTDRQKDRIDTFSGGMKRRVNIGIGLLHRPQLVYMDEPTVGIDPQSRRRILDTVLRLRDEYSMTVLYTTHLMEEAQELSDRVGIIDHGQIIALGTVGDLVQRAGEQDRLTFNIGAQALDEAFVERIRRSVPGVTRALYDPPGEEGEEKTNDSGLLIVYAARGRKVLAQIIQMLTEAGLEISSVQVREPDLEAVFLHLTGRALRD
ncbi:MAG: putative ABC transporter ATP-binding protein YfiL [Chloroflexota bacterium]|nr:MAG: putative ABC transporter ATP-binding protein YfiL [Chloroflexota bacterium]